MPSGQSRHRTSGGVEEPTRGLFALASSCRNRCEMPREPREPREPGSPFLCPSRRRGCMGLASPLLALWSWRHQASHRLPAGGVQAATFFLIRVVFQMEIPTRTVWFSATELEQETNSGFPARERPSCAVSTKPQPWPHENPEPREQCRNSETNHVLRCCLVAENSIHAGKVHSKHGNGPGPSDPSLQYTWTAGK